ncbi:hypothetical protein BJ742DRAFT_745059 [Cladochytrium replicatum]|nr:hypothetical protein BJ742DRAFT_745059 [Cladochytrium replicatum]
MNMYPVTHQELASFTPIVPSNAPYNQFVDELPATLPSHPHSAMLTHAHFQSPPYATPATEFHGGMNLQYSPELPPFTNPYSVKQTATPPPLLPPPQTFDRPFSTISFNDVMSPITPTIDSAQPFSLLQHPEPSSHHSYQSAPYTALSMPQSAYFPSQPYSIPRPIPAESEAPQYPSQHQTPPPFIVPQQPQSQLPVSQNQPHLYNQADESQIQFQPPSLPPLVLYDFETLLPESSSRSSQASNSVALPEPEEGPYDEAIIPTSSESVRGGTVSGSVKGSPGSARSLRGRRVQRHPLNGEKVYQCTEDDCSKYFKRAEHLKRHARVHTGEKPFVCPVKSCSKSFSRSDNLNAHIRTHKNKKGKSLYIADIPLPQSHYSTSPSSSPSDTTSFSSHYESSVSHSAFHIS